MQLLLFYAVMWTIILLYTSFHGVNFQSVYFLTLCQLKTGKVYTAGLTLSNRSLKFNGKSLSIHGIWSRMKLYKLFTYMCTSSPSYSANWYQLSVGSISFGYLVLHVADQTLTLWTPNYFCQTPVGADLNFSMLLLGADKFSPIFHLAPTYFSSLETVATPRELSCL